MAGAGPTPQSGLLGRLGIRSKDIWFVGDRLDTDVVGAKAAGMAAVWLNPSRRQDPLQTADLTVASWDELVHHARLAGTRMESGAPNSGVSDVDPVAGLVLSVCVAGCLLNSGYLPPLMGMR